MSNDYYYITTGSGNKMFTLRYFWVENRGRHTVERRDFIKVLSSDFDTAYEKAKKYVGDQPLKVFANQVEDRREASEIDHTLMPNGKYQGQSYLDVPISYLEWWVVNYQFSPSYKKTWESAIERVLEESDNVKWHLKRWMSKKSIDSLNRDTKWEIQKKRKARQSDFVGEPGSSMDLELTIFHTHDFENQYGWSTIYLMKDSEGNIFKKFGTINERYYTGENTIHVNADIKNHETYKGTKQTQIGRVRNPKNK